jgi:hypothetical protein
MWQALPWGAIFSALMSLIGFIIKRSDQHKEAEELFLKFISDLESSNVPIKVNEKYRAQIERIRKEIRNA